MRIKLCLLTAGLVLSSTASAQTHNGFNTLPEYNLSTSDMSWAYGPDRKERSAAVVLARLRSLCSSTHHYEQYYCARGMKLLNKAYAELKLRKAAESTFTE